MADLEQEIKFVFADSDLGKLADTIISKMQKGGVAGASKIVSGGEVSGGIAKAGGGSGEKSMIGLLGGILAAVGVIAVIFSALDPVIRPLFKVLSAVILILFMPFLRLFLPLLRTGIPKLIDFAKQTADFISDLLDRFNLPEAFQKLAEGDVLGFFYQIFEGIQNVGSDIWNWISENIGGWLSVLSGWGQTILDFVVSNLPSWLGTLVGWGEKVINFIVTNLPSWLQSLTDFGFIVMDFIIANLPSWMNTLFDLGITILDYIIKNLPDWVKDLVGLGYEILAVVITNLPEWLGKLLDLGLVILNKIIEKLPTWLAKLVDLGLAIFNAAGIAILKGFDVLANVGQMILDFINTALANATSSIQQFANNAVNFIQEKTGFKEEQDFISRNGVVTPFSSQDTVIGFKGKLGGGGITYSPQYRIEAGVDGSKLQRILVEHDRSLLDKMKKQGTYGGRIFNV